MATLAWASSSATLRAVTACRWAPSRARYQTRALWENCADIRALSYVWRFSSASSSALRMAWAPKPRVTTSMLTPPI